MSDKKPEEKCILTDMATRLVNEIAFDRTGITLITEKGCEHFTKFPKDLDTKELAKDIADDIVSAINEKIESEEEQKRKQVLKCRKCGKRYCTAEDGGVCDDQDD